MKLELLGVCFDRYMYGNLETILLILSYDFFTLQTMYPRVHHSFHFDFVLGRQQKLELRVPSYVYFFPCTYHVDAWVGFEEQQP